MRKILPLCYIVTVFMSSHESSSVRYCRLGWLLYPYAISIHDFEPIVGSLHMPPPIHQMFVAEGFVICNFVPRLFDFHKDAVPAPYYHSNVDSDEVIYYVEGDFMSRQELKRAVSHCIPGLVHGPQPEN